MSEREFIRIASGQGFWGDRLQAPVEQVRRGPIDYLMLDYLAAVTMSIMQKQRSRDPSQGYARDFVPLMSEILPDCVEKNIRVVANAGGVNTDACADAVLAAARKAGLVGRARVGHVSGDDIMQRLEDLVERGHELRNMETDALLADVLDRIQSANAYIGAQPIIAALNRGAHVVITGRSTDTALTYAPMMHAFGWAADSWDRLAAGVVAGHINECGAQASGGNALVAWQQIEDLSDVGYPIIKAYPDGTFVVTKHAGTGGRVSVPVVAEQILYEMGDPRTYITPDVVADVTSIQLQDEGVDRVRVHGIRDGRALRRVLHSGKSGSDRGGRWHAARPLDGTPPTRCRGGPQPIRQRHDLRVGIGVQVLPQQRGMEVRVPDRRRRVTGFVQRAHQAKRDAGIVGTVRGQSPRPDHCIPGSASLVGVLREYLDRLDVSGGKSHSLAVGPMLELDRVGN